MTMDNTEVGLTNLGIMSEYLGIMSEYLGIMSEG